MQFRGASVNKLTPNPIGYLTDPKHLAPARSTRLG
ncbi:hypothetical protein JXVLWARM_CDS_0012 [Burkholderia phage Bm1]